MKHTPLYLIAALALTGIGCRSSHKSAITTADSTYTASSISGNAFVWRLDSMEFTNIVTADSVVSTDSAGSPGRRTVAYGVRIDRRGRVVSATETACSATTSAVSTAVSQSHSESRSKRVSAGGGWFGTLMYIAAAATGIVLIWRIIRKFAA